MVKQKVYEHFTEPRWNRYTVKREHPISFGSKTGVADVVLLDSKSQLASIVECKGIRYENGGIDQLKSYLSASDAPLGVFANSLDPDDWVCYENLKRGRFREISQSQFESRILKTGPIQALGNFLRKIFRRRLPDNAVDPNPPETSPFEHAPYISYDTTGGFPSMYNENRTPSDVELGLNGEPYYSNRNGFYWATNHRGVAELIPQHIEKIIRNEEIATASTPVNLENEIDQMHNTKSQLLTEKEGVEKEIDSKENELLCKEKELQDLQKMSEAPTSAELNSASVGVDVNGQPSIRQSKWSLVARSIVPLVATLALIGSMCYLFVFYASAGDKAFSGHLGSVEAQLNEIINPYAFIQGLEKSNWFVVLFPCLFLLLAMVVHFAYVSRARLLVGVPLSITLFLDVAIALKIALNIRDDKAIRGLPPDPSWIIAFNVLTVLFLGLAISVLWSIGFHWVIELWKKVKTTQSDYADEGRRKQIQKEKAERESQIGSIEIDRKFLGRKIDESKSRLNDIRERINRVESEIKELSARDGKFFVVNRKTIESKINEFLNGWCRFVAHNENGDADISVTIQRIRDVAAKTLDEYYAGLYDQPLNRDTTPTQ